MLFSFNELEIGAVFQFGKESVGVKVSDTQWYNVNHKGLVTPVESVLDIKLLILLRHNLVDVFDAVGVL